MSANADAALRLVEARPPRLPEVHDALKDILGDTVRASSVLRHVRSLLRKDSSKYAPVELNGVIKEVIQLVELDASARRIELDAAFAEDVGSVLGDRIQIQQVALNLLMNAFDAVDNHSGGRRVRVRTARREAYALIEVQTTVQACRTRC